ncbi:MAG: hypothetical protein M3145_03920, partial [Pseudomonadota bacterium]|nr:hypothetical protein [Pseudomonadota bacterium]
PMSAHDDQDHRIGHSPRGDRDASSGGTRRVFGLDLAGCAHQIADLPINAQPASVSDQGTWPLKGNDFDETSFAGYHASFPAPKLRAAS